MSIEATPILRNLRNIGFLQAVADCAHQNAAVYFTTAEDVDWFTQVCCEAWPGYDLTMSHPEDRSEPGRLASRSVFAGRVVNLTVDRVRLPNGHETELEMIRHPGAAVALPLEVGEDGVEIALLFRQYRYAADGWLLEVPGGKLDEGESPEECILRELEEETGYRATTLEPLGWIWTTPGFTDERIWLFVARGLEEVAEGSRLETDEVLELVRLPLARAVAMAANDEITDAKTVATLLRAGARHGTVAMSS